MKDINIFVSYSSRDRDLRKLLVGGLKGHLVHRGDFTYHLWDDTAIDLGAEWEKTIDTALDKSNVALLLVSANFAASEYISKNELTAFFKKKNEAGCLILPVLLRTYDFRYFEELASLNFFKTYYSEYGFNNPLVKHELLPFDKLAESNTTTDAQLNNYYAQLAKFIHTAVVNFYSTQKSEPSGESKTQTNKDKNTAKEKANNAHTQLQNLIANTVDEFKKERLNDLKKRLERLQKLLKQYEELQDLEDDPKKLMKYDHEIQKLDTQIGEVIKEMDTLNT